MEAGVALLVQGDAEPRSCKKRLLSIEHNVADNSYKKVEMDEYNQEINDKIAILRLELWKSKDYQVPPTRLIRSLLFTHLPQVPRCVTSLSEVEQLAYTDLILKNNQTKHIETPIEVHTH